ncbi:hypothetical protein AG1IA_09912 [Rhizoctonia solani AG-1 IA]|uniref:Uncharacterized protein n=1 Tax=Thanatephorus cucumeris (strain AG1-IA) TaxID=983506 RepID=L8WH02_THACA|nr:hypothetical protein AG1IA_09912 [Rhizoctonia solani AG-1 IA]
MNKGQSVWTMEISDLSAAVSGGDSNSATSNHVGKVVQDQPSHYQQPQYDQPAQHHPQGMAQCVLPCISTFPPFLSVPPGCSILHRYVN